VELRSVPKTNSRVYLHISTVTEKSLVTLTRVPYDVYLNNLLHFEFQNTGEGNKVFTLVPEIPIILCGRCASLFCFEQCSAAQATDAPLRLLVQPCDEDER
jgi:hypothetical protein